ncbi:17414_t:CDS:2, partial [Acaulospora morrowiae]
SAGLARIGCMEKYKLVRDWAESLASSYMKIGLKPPLSQMLHTLYHSLWVQSTTCVDGMFKISPENCPAIFALGIN